ncbi:MAG: hypothetical protein A2144_12275 [Chloroflexi bacterium RBG_16_50_9]|nr:MAG: hypothetical protein A2144_12275 [Chloroflexi bacterium RBG_16_50_9]
MRKEIRIAGFGGQGGVLSGNILGKAASIFTRGYAVLTQNYGPESRGGACTTEIVTSDEPIDYPYVITPNIQLILSQEAYNKFGQKALPETLVIIDSELVKADPNQRPQPIGIPASRLARNEIGRPVTANIIMLGFLAAVSDVISFEALKSAVLDSIPKETEDINMKALELGYNYNR